MIIPQAISGWTFAERLVLDHDDFDRKLVPDGGCNPSHEHGKPTVSDEGHRLTVRIGNLRGNGTAETVGHRYRCAESENGCPRLAWICRTNHVEMVPESDETIALLDSRFLQSDATAFGFMGRSRFVPGSSKSCLHSVDLVS